MASGATSPKYLLLHDGDELDIPRGPARWVKPGFGIVLLATSFPLAMCVLVKCVGRSTSGATRTETEVFEKIPPVEVFPHFDGSTSKFGGYGFKSGGHFSATLHHYRAGSESTAFLLDHRLQYIVDGEVRVTDGTGQTFLGKPGDLFYLAYGSNITHHTPKGAKTYVSIADEADPILPEQVAALQPKAYQTWVSESARTTKIAHFAQIYDKHNNVFGDQHLFFNGLGCWKWNTDQLPSNKWTKSNMSTSPTWNFCCGIFHLNSGPPAFTSGKYNNHEELDFIIDGEFNARARDGQKFAVKKGDLVHNPRHMDVLYETPASGAFFSTSLSPVNDFFPQSGR